MTLPAEIDACVIALAAREGPKPGQQWIHLLPSGTFTGRDGRGPYRAADPDAIMQASRRWAGRTAIPVDYEHQIDMAATNGRPAPAAGWITGLQARADGIWGLVEWTARAARHLAEREYRYLSPAIRHLSDGTVTAILRASLVNNPNLDQLTALASMENRPMSETIDIAELRETLGLPETADIAAIRTKLNDVMMFQTMGAATPDPSKYVPIGDFTRVTQELTRVHKGIEETAAKHHVEEHVRAGKLLPFMRDWAVSLCTVNKPAFDEFISKTGGKFEGYFCSLLPGAQSPPPSLHSRGAPALDDVEAEVASRLGLTPEQFNKAGGK